MRTIPGCWTGFRGSSEMPQHRRSAEAADEWVEALTPTLNTVCAPPGMLELLRACRKIARDAAARDFGWGQDGAGGASPQRAVTLVTTKPQAKRPAARRVFAERAAWLRCSSVEDPPGVFSFVAPRHPAFSAKTAPLGIFRQALTETGSVTLAASTREALHSPAEMTRELVPTRDSG